MRAIPASRGVAAAEDCRKLAMVAGAGGTADNANGTNVAWERLTELSSATALGRPTS